MTDTNKHIPDDQKAAESKTNASGELKDTELENVNGGWGMAVASQVSQVLKNFGDALNTAARGG